MPVIILDSVLEPNTKIETFPTNVVANALTFSQKECSEVDDTSRAPVSVRFD